MADVNNHIAEHHLQTKHEIDRDSATCITYSTDYYQRLTLESWFTNFDSEDDYRTGCRNVSYCQQQQSYSGLRSPGRSNLLLK